MSLKYEPASVTTTQRFSGFIVTKSFGSPLCGGGGGGAPCEDDAGDGRGSEEGDEYGEVAVPHAVADPRAVVVEPAKHQTVSLSIKTF